MLPIDRDILTDAILPPGNPFLPSSSGALDANGDASSLFHIPSLPFLSGVRVYATTVTLDQPTFPLARTVIADPLVIQIH